MEEMMQLIGNLGFPIAIALFVLVRLDTKLENLVQAITTSMQTQNAKSDSLIQAITLLTQKSNKEV